MPFDSRKQQQWYHATNQDYLDDEPSSHRKVEAGTSQGAKKAWLSRKRGSGQQDSQNTRMKNIEEPNQINRKITDKISGL